MKRAAPKGKDGGSAGTREASVRVAPQHEALCGWDSDDAARVLAAARRWIAPSHDAISRAAAMLPEVETPPTADWFPKLFGPPTAAHAFERRSGLFGFRALEPHYTTILAAFMQPGEQVGRRLAHARARSFVEALKRATGSGLDHLHLPPDAAPVVVEAECRTTEARDAPRLDLLLSWTAEGEPHALGIEVKFGAYGPHAGQLASYDGLIRQTANGLQRRAGRLLLATRIKRKDGAKGWVPLHWRTLLRHWETAIAEAGDDDPAFAAFRSGLWAKALPE